MRLVPFHLVRGLYLKVVTSPYVATTLLQAGPTVSLPVKMELWTTLSSASTWSSLTQDKVRI
jgi:hypothetical protein